MILEGGREYLFVSKQSKFEFEQADGSQYLWVGVRKVSEVKVKEKEYKGEGFSRCFILV